MVLSIIVGIIGAVLLGIGVTYLTKDLDSPGGWAAGVVGVILLLILLLGLIPWLPGTPLKNIEPGTYDIASASLDLLERTEDKRYSIKDVEAVHMIIWIYDSGIRRLETRYFRPQKEAFARPELLTPENLRKVKAIKVIKVNGFKKIELIMEYVPNAPPEK